MKRRLILLVISLPLVLVALLAVGFFTLLHTTVGANWALGQLQARLAGEFTFAEAQGNLGSGLELSEIQYRDQAISAWADKGILALSPRLSPLGVDLETVIIRSLTVQLSDSEDGSSTTTFPESLALPLMIDVRRFSIDGIELVNSAGQSIMTFQALDLSARVHESLHLREFSLKASDMQFGAEGGVALQSPYPFELGLSSSMSFSAGDSSTPMPVVFEGRIEGRPDEYRLISSGSVGAAGSGRVDLAIEGNGDLAGLELEAEGLSGEFLEFTSRGAVAWSENLEATLNLELRRLDPSPWVENWPADFPVTGGLSAAYAAGLWSVSHFDLRATKPGFQVSGNGRLSPLSEHLAAELRWSAVQWPPHSEQAFLRSANGAASLSGTLDDWTVAGAARLEAAELPEGELRFDANGDREHMEIQLISGQVLGGGINGDLTYRFGEQEWSTRLTLDKLKTDKLFRELPGSLSGDLTAFGSIEPFVLDLGSGGLSGEVRGLPVTAAGHVRVRDGGVEIDDLRLEATDSHLVLDGSLYAGRGLTFSADIGNLGSFLQPASGRVKARGRLSFQEQAPGLSMSLQASAIDWAGSRVLDELVLNADEQAGQQSLGVSLLYEDLSLNALLLGRLTHKGPWPSVPEWSGQLGDLKLEQGVELLLELVRPAPLKLTGSSVNVDGACLDTLAGGQVCSSAQWSAGGNATADASLEALPLALVERLIETGLDFSQLVDGTIHWQTKNRGEPFASVDLRLSPGDVSFKGDTEPLFTTGPGRAGFQLAYGRISAGHLDVPLPGNGKVESDFSVLDYSLGAGAGIKGRIGVILEDLELFGALLPLLERSDGRLEADLALSGILGQPTINGSISLTDGMIQHEASGLRLDDIQLSGHKQGKGEMRLAGNFNAVEGQGHLQATLRFEEHFSPAVVLDVDGENLTLLDSPDVKLVVTPDIRLSWQDRQLTVGGSLLIPSALLAPGKIRQAPAVESADLVIVSQDAPAEPESIDTETVSIRGDLLVELGNDVVLDIDVAKLDVGGAVEFHWRDDPMPIASGNYVLEGEILAYGQLLEISQGNIGFPDVPADNPHLNIRAERQIYGNSEVRRAGLFISGTLSHPLLEPYTEPMTNRERAQTLLVTGSDFNMETGVGAVDIGTYIAPRIFVSYGIGVFDNENIISVRYDLGKGWGVKATSGQRQTGVDMSYTFER